MEKSVCICIFYATKVLDVDWSGTKIAELKVNQLAVIGQRFYKKDYEKEEDGTQTIFRRRWVIYWMSSKPTIYILERKMQRSPCFNFTIQIGDW